jgi:DNA-binding LacI/PurR family transcriptional regulator
VDSQLGQRRKVTVNTVAKAAGVSRQTVTNALLHPERVRADTLARVQAEIGRLGYRPSAAAQSLQSQRSGAIGIELNALGPDYHNALMTPFLSALSIHARAQDCHMVTFASPTNEPTLAAYEQMWKSQVVDAFVIADTHHGDPRPDWLRSHQIPYASFGRVWDDPTFSAWVDVDGQHGTALAVDHCRAAGYRRIGYVGWPEGNSAVGDARHLGWQEGSLRRGWAALGASAFCIDDLGAASRAATSVIADIGSGGAIVCASDVIAVGVLHALRAAGLRPGLDVGVVGFDDSELARMHGVTSVAQPVDDIARSVLHLIGNAWTTQDTSPEPRESRIGDGTLLKPQLTIRESTARTAKVENRDPQARNAQHYQGDEG